MHLALFFPEDTVIAKEHRVYFTAQAHCAVATETICSMPEITTLLEEHRLG
jgi:hypothetical protein